MVELSSVLNEVSHQDSSENEEERKNLVKILKDKIVNGQTCSAWYLQLPQISEDELENTLKTYSYDFEDFAQRQDDKESGLKYTCIIRLTKRCIQAFINILLKNYSEVLPITAEAYKLIQCCIDEKYFSEDYTEGFRFVVNALEIYLEIENDCVNRLSLVALQKSLDDLNSFQDLSVKNVVGVLALKQFFLGNITRGVYKEQIQIIKEMISLDPTNCEWHFYLSLVWRFYRESMITYGSPSDEERTSIQAAINVPGAESDPRILMNQILCLAEVLRNDFNGIIVSPLRFCSKIFYSAEEVVNFIRFEADKILSLDPISISSNIYISRIFSAILPFKFQDKHFAKICIKRTLMFHPHYSKANHRMGIFYLSEGNLSKAIEYTRRAYETDKRNFYSLMDLLRLYMHDINKYTSELNSTFDDAINSSFYRKFPFYLSNLLFTRAIHKYLYGKLSQTIELLVEAYTIDEKATEEYFGDIEYHAKRYNWHQNINGINILGRIRQLLSSTFRQCTNSLTKEKLLKLYEAARVAKQYSFKNINFCGRGYYGHGTGSRGHRNSIGAFGDHRGNNRVELNFYSNGQIRWENSSFREGFYRNIDYAVLGVSQISTKAEIKKAYYQLLLIHHPDKDSDLSEAEKLKKQKLRKQINKAWESLKAKHTSAY